MANYKLVHITTIDHHAQLQGEPGEPSRIDAVGFLVKEDAKGYHLNPMVFDKELGAEDNVTLFIAKVPGMKLKVVGRLK